VAERAARAKGRGGGRAGGGEGRLHKTIGVREPEREERLHGREEKGGG
jgi:hypothetical protein